MSKSDTGASEMSLTKERLEAALNWVTNPDNEIENPPEKCPHCGNGDNIMVAYVGKSTWYECFDCEKKIDGSDLNKTITEALQTLIDAKTAPTPEVDLEQLEMALKENSWVRTVEENNIIQSAAFKYLSEKTPPEKSE